MNPDCSVRCVILIDLDLDLAERLNQARPKLDFEEGFGVEGPN